ncbi:MAG: CPBP family intramembrane metalloprotease [Clostridium sp.]|nr:CPBP family intramembrane metalloprotease [Clostridium sp.]
MLLSICICKCIIEIIPTLLFSKILPLESSGNIQNSVLIIIFGVLISPIFEELMCRYGLLNFLNKKFDKYVSIIVCSIIFSLFHGYQLQVIIPCFCAGVVFSIIYLKTGNIGYSIISHIGCNTFSVVMNLLEHNNVKLFGMPLQYEINGYNMLHPVIIALGIIIVGIRILKARKLKRDSKIKG